MFLTIATTIVRATYYYDGDRNVISQTDANGNIVFQKQFDPYDRLTRETDALGNYTVYAYDKIGQVTRQTSHAVGGTALAEVRMEYDPAGRVTLRRQLASPGSPSDSDALVEISYDDSGRVTREITYLTDTAGASVTRGYIYDIAGRLMTQTGSDGPEIVMAYDKAGNLLTRISDPAGLALTETYAYDGVGRITRETRPDSTSVVRLYDIQGLLTKERILNAGGTAVSTTQNIYDLQIAKVLYTYQYADPTRANYAATDPQVQYTYGYYTGRLENIRIENGATDQYTYYYYDSLGRVTRTVDPASNQMVTVYDSADRILTRLRLDYDGVNTVTFKMVYGFDGLNRVTRTIEDPSGLALTMTVWYDALGRVTLTEDPAEQQTARLYDGLGRLTRLTEDYSGIDRYTDYAYDRASRLTRQTGYTNGASGAENTDYAYNKAGVKTLVTYPDSGTVNFVLDSVSRVTRQTDPRGISIDQAYDVMGRRTLKHEGTNIYWTYGYNVLGALTLARKGTSAGGDQVARTNRLYNGLGQLTLETQQITGALTRSVGYVYDLVGNLTALYYPGGDVTIAHTMTAGNQTDLIKRNGTQIGDYNYVGSQVKRLMYETGANDVTADRYYDGAGRLTRLAWDQTSNTLPKFNFAYDQGGNILTKTHDHRSGDPIEKYGIDSLYRLTDARYDFRSLTQHYVYDDLGNRLTSNTMSYWYNEVNELTKGQGAAWFYDAAGNVTQQYYSGSSSVPYYYDAENRLTKVSSVSGETETLLSRYQYDALGRRIEFIADYGAVTKRFLYDGDRVIEEYDGAATPVRQRYYVWGNYIDELLLMNDDAGDDSDYFVCHDQIYSPQALLNSTGSIVERYDYYAYGFPNIFTANGGDSDWWDGDETTSETSAKGLKYLFTGRELDNLDGNALKLHYYRARTYYPLLGRFLQRDPAGYVDGMNLYEYVLSRPTFSVDPFGYLAVDPFDPGTWPDPPYGDAWRFWPGGVPPLPPPPLQPSWGRFAKCYAACMTINFADEVVGGGVGLIIPRLKQLIVCVAKKAGPYALLGAAAYCGYLCRDRIPIPDIGDIPGDPRGKPVCTWGCHREPFPPVPPWNPHMPGK